ncbi:Hypothetical protein DEACI_4299 [Acididesulfobacillus acetoxydans]|uniref:Uncharacterized protein n=1 Tax=Acididesulfobacillus acetoxydans TaxID=1561005 RepID=A0A8S0WIM6_9FIRM|nr:Hypothetical protein DEACI_4299 [Acididesulfobacillus acetoxydans]CEJ06825.1 Hypothetical protein DEACI_1276 [Acididesulfobacillus acetoxydans]
MCEGRTFGGVRRVGSAGKQDVRAGAGGVCEQAGCAGEWGMRTK